MTSIPRPITAKPTVIDRPFSLSSVWPRLALPGVTALAAALYLFNLTVSGYANTYYSAAAWAASQSWSAWFFGSIDPANFITVDKPPLSTMLMGLSVRLFGLSSWSVLLPQALLGVGTVAVLFVVVRRSFGPAAATIAAVVATLTPAAVLIFRYNNPDALLTFLLVASAWTLLKALERGSLRWIVATGLLVGLAFNTKYLQAYLVLPAFLLVWLVATHASVRRRLAGLVVGGVTVALSSFWWVAAVELIPAADRPYIGGSETNSAVQLLLGYDGLARIFGFGSGSGGGPGGGGPGGGGGGFSGEPGLLRLFNAQLGGQVAWLIPFAIIALVVGLIVVRRAPRTDTRRAQYLLWGGWLAVTGLVFSLMSGIIHSYYSVALAPAIGALVGAGTVEMWRLRRRHVLGGLPLAGAVAITGAVAYELLSRTPAFAPGLAEAILVAAIVTAVVIAIPWQMVSRPIQLAAGALLLVVLLAGPAAYAADSVNTAFNGGDPSAGPTARDGFFGGGANPGFQFGRGGFGGGPAGGSGGAPGGGFAGGPGGASVDDSLVSYLVAHQGNATWIVAVNGANDAGTIELEARQPVLAMGGFSGTDPAPTLDQLKTLVSEGKLRYIILGGQGGPGGSSQSDISAWVQSVGTVVDYGGSGSTLYDLSGAAASSTSGG